MDETTQLTRRLTAEFLADAFCLLGAGQQADFFALVAERVQEWPEPDAGDESQWETVGDLVKRSSRADSVRALVAEWDRCFGRTA